jgi:hypothetical protein
VTWRERSGNLARTRRGPPPFSGERKAKLAQITGKFTGKFLDFIHFLGNSTAKYASIFGRLQPNSLADQSREFFEQNREIISAEQGK